MNDICKNIEECSPNKKCKILIVFDDMISDVLSNKKLNPIRTELFIRGRKLNITYAFIWRSYFAEPKKIKLNSMHYYIMKFQTNQSFNKLHLSIHKIFTFKIL